MAKGPFKTELEIDGAKADIISFSYSFSQAIDSRSGQPMERLKNGLIKLIISPGSVQMEGKVLKWLHGQSGTKHSDGNINFYTYSGAERKKNPPFKVISFKNAIVVAYEEVFEDAGQHQGVEKFSVSAESIIVEYKDSGDTYDFHMQWS